MSTATTQATSTWTLSYQQRPWTLNSERGRGGKDSGHWAVRSRLKAEWRHAFKILAREQCIPPLQWVQVTVLHHCRDRRLPDPVACFPAYKAALDGVVDARVIRDDGPAYVHSVTFEAPVTTGVAELVLVLEGPAVAPS